MQALEPSAKRYPWLIDGHTHDDPLRETIAVTDPATGLAVGVAPVASAADVDAAIDAAMRAYPAWAANRDLRRRCMHQAAAVIDDHRSSLGALLTREQGKPLSEAEREVERFATWLRYYADLEQYADVRRDDSARFIRVVQRPLGVVAAITPWNFPVSLLGWKVAPALAAGNTIVARPSSLTPLTTLELAALLQDVFPPGVLNAIAGGRASAERLVNSPHVRKIGFTGSTETGRTIMRTAGPDLKRVTLELGGNDAAIVLDDVDLDRIDERLFWAAFYNCGQVCIAVKRLFVPRSMLPSMVERLTDRARSVRLGHGLEPGTQMGPLNNAAQRQRVEELVQAARAAGGQVVTGGRSRPGPGYFYEPTIVTDVSPGDRLVDEEQFGPALPVIGYDDLDDVIALAAASRFGLGASVWTSDPSRAEPIGDQLDVGTLWINQHQEAVPDAPFGGARESGLGYENGLPGLEAYTQLQTRNERRE
jgi:acyl-CoA reductase-like NAD-dependent aldehyde dehydrogenase